MADVCRRSFPTILAAAGEDVYFGLVAAYEHANGKSYLGSLERIPP